MRAKVALSLAMAHQPELLVLDEPTSGLDTLVRREFLESMVDLAAAGRTVLLSSHQIGEVERVADIVAIMPRGQVLLVERLDELKRTTREVTVTMQEAAGARRRLPGRGHLPASDAAGNGNCWSAGSRTSRNWSGSARTTASWPWRPHAIAGRDFCGVHAARRSRW